MYDHLHPAISYSKLSLLDQSVVKYYNRYVLKLQEPVKSSFRFGNAFDAYITEPALFEKNWKIKNTATTNIEMCITTIEYEIILKMVDSLLNFNNWGNQSLILKNYTLGEIFKIADMQFEAFWTDKNISCRGKFDVDLILPTNRLIFDIKTTNAESIEDCVKSVFNFKYYLQASHYVNAALNLTPDLIPIFNFVFVSKTTFECWVLNVTDEVLEYGNKERDRLIAKLIDLESSGDYLKPQPCANIWLPNWLKNKQ